MMHLRGLVLFLLCLPGGARRSMRTNDSHQDAQQNSTLANGLEVSADAREPGGFGARFFRRLPSVSAKPFLTELGQPAMSDSGTRFFRRFARRHAGPTMLAAGDDGAYGFSVRDLESNNEVDLSKYKGSVSLIVNVASK